MDQVRLRRLLQRQQRLDGPPLVALGRRRVVGVGDLAHEARERKLADQQIGRALVLSDLAERDGTRPVRAWEAAAVSAGSIECAAGREGNGLRRGRTRLKRCFLIGGTTETPATSERGGGRRACQRGTGACDRCNGGEGMRSECAAGSASERVRLAAAPAAELPASCFRAGCPPTLCVRRGMAGAPETAAEWALRFAREQGAVRGRRRRSPKKCMS